MHFTERFLRDQLPVSTLCDFSGNSGVPLPEGAFSNVFLPVTMMRIAGTVTEYDKYDAGPGPGLFHTAEVGSDDHGGWWIPLTCRLPFFDKAGMEWPSVLRAGSFYSSLCAYRRNGLAAGEFRFLDAPEGNTGLRWRTAGEGRRMGGHEIWPKRGASVM